MSNTAYTGSWDAIMPKQFQVQGLREDVLIWLMDRQKGLIQKHGIEDPRIAAFIILDDVIADQKAMRWTPAINSFFVEGRHLAITVLIASQYVKGVGPMIRGNCDYIFVQPIYNQPQRQTLWEMEGAFTDKKTWNRLMDEVIVRETLPGNTAREPRKRVQIMVCACFEDCGNPREKLFYWSPVHMSQLPDFRLCADEYWNESARMSEVFTPVEARPSALVLRDVVTELGALSN